MTLTFLAIFVTDYAFSWNILLINKLVFTTLRFKNAFSTIGGYNIFFRMNIALITNIISSFRCVDTASNTVIYNTLSTSSTNSISLLINNRNHIRSNFWGNRTSLSTQTVVKEVQISAPCTNTFFVIFATFEAIMFAG